MINQVFPFKISKNIVMPNKECPNAGDLEMSCSVDKVACMSFSWKFNFYPLLINYVA
jgi:hypothetical protein